MMTSCFFCANAELAERVSAAAAKTSATFFIAFLPCLASSEKSRSAIFLSEGARGVAGLLTDQAFLPHRPKRGSAHQSPGTFLTFAHSPVNLYLRDGSSIRSAKICRPQSWVTGASL